MLAKNLDDYVREKIEQMTPKGCVSFFTNPKTKKPITVTTALNWQKEGAVIPTWAAQLVLNEQVKFVTPEGEVASWEKKNLIIGLPFYKSTNPHTLFALMCLQDKHHPKIGFDIITRTMIVQARNILATRFMKTTADWLLMIDDDMVFPCGRADLYTNRFGAKADEPFASMDIVSRLLSHKKPLVGALYFGRHENGRAQYAEALADDAENRYAHDAPYNELKPTKWLATGGMLIHRSVFEAIEKKFPDIMSDKNDNTTGNGYFTPIAANCGEDMSFCTRASDCDIQSYVDMGCMMGHIGSKSYWGHNTTC